MEAFFQEGKWEKMKIVWIQKIAIQRYNSLVCASWHIIFSFGVQTMTPFVLLFLSESLLLLILRMGTGLAQQLEDESKLAFVVEAFDE